MELALNIQQRLIYHKSNQPTNQPTNQKSDSLNSLTISPIGNRSWYVPETTSSVCTELMHVSYCWSANTGVSMCSSPPENFAYEFIPVSPACLDRLS